MKMSRKNEYLGSEYKQREKKFKLLMETDKNPSIWENEQYYDKWQV